MFFITLWAGCFADAAGTPRNIFWAMTALLHWYRKIPWSTWCAICFIYTCIAIANVRRAVPTMICFLIKEIGSLAGRTYFCVDTVTTTLKKVRTWSTIIFIFSRISSLANTCILWDYPMVIFIANLTDCWRLTCYAMTRTSLTTQVILS